MEKIVSLKELKIDYVVEQFKDFLNEIKVDDFNIKEIVRDYPARKARYSLALARTKAKLLWYKALQKKVYYEIYKEIRENAKSKLTEEMIKSMIYTDDRYMEITKKVIELEEKVGILEACKQAFDDLGRMIYLIFDKEEINSL